MDFQAFDASSLLADLSRVAEELRPFVTDTTELLREGASEGRRILFEGANASLLDIDFGTFPFVTSSNCVTPAIRTSIGVGSLELANSIGVAKAYVSRVGAGPFPTENDGEESKLIRERAQEYGTSTGRPRRIGWLDLVALGHTVRLNGLTEMVLTGLGFLHGLPQLKVCTAYDIDGERTTEFPASARSLGRARAVYETLPGFEAPISECGSAADLPEAVSALVDLIHQHTGTQVSAVCTGKSREQVLAL
jgi:adenylosuccinate synthase